MLPTNQSKLTHNRLVVVLSLLNDYRNIAQSLVSLIGNTTLTGILLIERLQAATVIRAALALAIGGEGNAVLRTELATQFGIADISAEITATNTASTVMLSDMSDLIAAITGQAVTANDTTGRVDYTFNSGETSTLLTSANALLVEITASNT